MNKCHVDKFREHVTWNLRVIQEKERELEMSNLCRYSVGRKEHLRHNREQIHYFTVREIEDPLGAEHCRKITKSSAHRKRLSVTCFLSRWKFHQVKVNAMTRLKAKLIGNNMAKNFRFFVEKTVHKMVLNRVNPILFPKVSPWQTSDKVLTNPLFIEYIYHLSATLVLAAWHS